MRPVDWLNPAYPAFVKELCRHVFCALILFRREATLRPAKLQENYQFMVIWLLPVLGGRLEGAAAKIFWLSLRSCLAWLGVASAEEWTKWPWALSISNHTWQIASESACPLARPVRIEDRRELSQMPSEVVSFLWTWLKITEEQEPL